jgi:hypothetical protein
MLLEIRKTYISSDATSDKKQEYMWFRGISMVTNLSCKCQLLWSSGSSEEDFKKYFPM